MSIGIPLSELPLQDELSTNPQAGAKTEIPQKDTYTYADYALLPEGSPYQLIGGKLVITPAPSPRHQAVSMRLIKKLLSFLAANDCGVIYHAPIDVYFSEHETYQPDLLFISRERMDIIGPDKINGAPDLVIEILSPHTAYYDLRKKARVYARTGVKEYWVVDPEEQSIEVYAGSEGKFTLVDQAEGEGKIHSRLLEGLEVEVGEVFG